MTRSYYLEEGTHLKPFVTKQYVDGVLEKLLSNFNLYGPVIGRYDLPLEYCN